MNSSLKPIWDNFAYSLSLEDAKELYQQLCQFEATIHIETEHISIELQEDEVSEDVVETDAIEPSLT